MSEPYKGLNAALARNSGPSAEDVEALAFVFREAIFAGGANPTWLAEALIESSWFAAHTAAAEARGAERGARAVVEALRSGMPTTAFDNRYRDGYASGIFTAERAARAAAEQTGGEAERTPDAECRCYRQPPHNAECPFSAQQQAHDAASSTNFGTVPIVPNIVDPLPAEQTGGA